MSHLRFWGKNSSKKGKQIKKVLKEWTFLPTVYLLSIILEANFIILTYYRGKPGICCYALILCKHWYFLSGPNLRVSNTSHLVSIFVTLFFKVWVSLLLFVMKMFLFLTMRKEYDCKLKFYRIRSITNKCFCFFSYDRFDF